MCQELQDALDNGNHHAVELARHLIEMGAAAATLPVWIDDERYEVVVKHVPVKPE